MDDREVIRKHTLGNFHDLLWAAMRSASTRGTHNAMCARWRVHGGWRGLQPENLFEGGDLAVTTDYRDVLGEVLVKRLKNPNVAEVFPNYRVTMRGVVH